MCVEIVVPVSGVIRTVTTYETGRNDMNSSGRKLDTAETEKMQFEDE